MYLQIPGDVALLLSNSEMFYVKNMTELYFQWLQRVVWYLLVHSICCCFLCSFLNRCLPLYFSPEVKRVIEEKNIIRNQIKPNMSFNIEKQKYRASLKRVYFRFPVPKQNLSKCVCHCPRNAVQQEDYDYHLILWFRFTLLLLQPQIYRVLRTFYLLLLAYIELAVQILLLLPVL